MPLILITRGTKITHSGMEDTEKNGLSSPNAVVKFLMNREAYLGACSVVQKVWRSAPSTLMLTSHWGQPAYQQGQRTQEQQQQ